MYSKRGRERKSFICGINAPMGKKRDVMKKTPIKKEEG